MSDPRQGGDSLRPDSPGCRGPFPNAVHEVVNGAPLVTVITATMNAAATIDQALASVAAQSALGRLEHLVVDGGSVDGTVGRAARAAHRPRILTGPDHGVYDAFSKGLAAARGEWITFLGADDAYADPRAIELVLRAAADQPDVDVLHGDVDWIDAGGQVVRRGRFLDTGSASDYADFTHRLPIFHPATFCRRRVFERVGCFDPSYRIAGDYDLLLRAWLAGARFRHLPAVLMRLGVGGLSDDPVAAELEVARACRRRLGQPVARGALRVGRVAMVDLLERWTPRLLGVGRSVRRRLLPAPTPRGAVIQRVVGAHAPPREERERAGYAAGEDELLEASDA